MRGAASSLLRKRTRRNQAGTPYAFSRLELEAVARNQRLQRGRRKMALCPIALVAGCQKCPAFSVCPLKGVIGDYKKPGEPPKGAGMRP